MKKKGITPAERKVMRDCLEASSQTLIAFLIRHNRWVEAMGERMKLIVTLHEFDTGTGRFADTKKIEQPV